MRRRLQGIKHTDCTARTIFGRRNRYAPTATTITGTPFFDLSSRKIADVSQLAEINQYAPSAVQFGAAEACNSVLYFLPIRSISTSHTIYSITELLAVKIVPLMIRIFDCGGSFLFHRSDSLRRIFAIRTALTLGDRPIEISTVGREFVRFYFT